MRNMSVPVRRLDYLGECSHDCARYVREEAGEGLHGPCERHGVCCRAHTTLHDLVLTLADIVSVTDLGQ